MQYLGLDVHKSFTTMGRFDPATGELAHLGNVPTGQRELREALERLPGPKTVVLEAGRKSHWVAAMVEPVADQVWIVDPLEVRRLQGRKPKTDRRDAVALARWAARGALTPRWRPDTQTMDLRELTRGRAALGGGAGSPADRQQDQSRPPAETPAQASGLSLGPQPRQGGGSAGLAGSDLASSHQGGRLAATAGPSRLRRLRRAHG